MKTSEKLLERLDREFGYEFRKSGAKCRRCYHGRHQRDAGAFSWSTIGNGGPSLGSIFPMRAILSAAKLKIDKDGYVWPEPEPQQRRFGKAKG